MNGRRSFVLETCFNFPAIRFSDDRISGFLSFVNSDDSRKYLLSYAFPEKNVF